MLDFQLPRLDPQEGSPEAQKIKNYLYQLTEQLRFLLENIGPENLDGELYDAYQAQLKTPAQIEAVQDYAEHIMAADRIISQYESGIWRITKWSSGKAVAETKDRQSQSVDFSTAFGSTGLYLGTLSVTHPAGLFTEVSMREMQSASNAAMFLGGINAASDLASTGFYVYYRASGARTVYYTARITGRYR